MSHYTTEQRVKLAEYLHGRISNAGQAWYSMLSAEFVRLTHKNETVTFYPKEHESTK